MDDYVSKPVRPDELQRALEATAAAAHTDVHPGAMPRLPAAVDGQALANLRELQEPDEPSFVVELIEHFIVETPVRLASIANAIASGDAQGLNRLAHSLKASCGILGAVHMASMCATLEQAGAEGALEHAGASLEAACVEFERVRAVLRAECGSDGVEDNAVA